MWFVWVVGGQMPRTCVLAGHGAVKHLSDHGIVAGAVPDVGGGVAYDLGCGGDCRRDISFEISSLRKNSIINIVFA